MGFVIEMAHKNGPDLRYICVCCEQVNFTPVNVEWLLNKMAQRRETMGIVLDNKTSESEKDF